MTTAPDLPAVVRPPEKENLMIPKLSLPFTTGAHQGQADACLLEFAWAVDHVQRKTKEDKTDHPSTVHPIIADLGIRAWDAEDDDEKRRALLGTVACQLDTAGVDDKTTNGLAAFVCTYVADRMPEGTDERVTAALRAAATCLLDPSDANKARAAEAAEAAGAAWAAGAAGAARAAEAAEAAEAARAARAAEAAEAAEAAWAAGAAFYADLLRATIAEFDRLTGRTTCRKITAADYRKAEKVILGV